LFQSPITFEYLPNLKRGAGGFGEMEAEAVAEELSLLVHG